MDFNSLFFPAPQSNQTCLTHFKEMIYIPKYVPPSMASVAPPARLASDANELREAVFIPCLLIKY